MKNKKKLQSKNRKKKKLSRGLVVRDLRVTWFFSFWYVVGTGYKKMYKKKIKSILLLVGYL